MSYKKRLTQDIQRLRRLTKYLFACMVLLAFSTGLAIGSQSYFWAGVLAISSFICAFFHGYVRKAHQDAQEHKSKLEENGYV